ncbi:unnamed protein product [Gongylonema pulchrum]|uniref:Pecanex-like protein n=1 Tax=Gongylonema pulchrum TaxID=637853 RepID=A0A183EIT1_9BILA|nr:unnamed protein product [Gongylonema pulchrum]
MAELDDALNFTDDRSLSEAMAGTEVSEKAPLAFLQEICSGISMDPESASHNGCEIVCENCKTVVYRDGAIVGACSCKRGSATSRFRIVPVTCRDALESVQSASTLQREDTVSTLSGATVVRRGTQQAGDGPSKVFDPLENLSLESDTAQQTSGDPQEATYLDVAVIRCLLIKHWAEDGVFWALKYLLNRLSEIKIYRNSQSGMFRSRASSAPSVPHLKIFPSEMENRQDLQEIQHRAPTWEDLQLNGVTKKFKNQDADGRLKVSFPIRPSKKYALSSPMNQPVATPTRVGGGNMRFNANFEAVRSLTV